MMSHDIMSELRIPPCVSPCRHLYPMLKKYINYGIKLKAKNKY